MTKRIAVFAVLVFGVFVFASGGFAESGKRYGGKRWFLSAGPYLEYAKWEEDVSGAKDVTEDGFRYGLEAGLTVYPEREASGSGWFNYWTARLTGRVFFSRSMDYDGSYWDGTPVSGDVHHAGWSVEALFGLGRKEPDRVILPFVALEWSEWERDAVFDGGYLESWETGVIKLGLIYAFRYGGGAVELSGAVGTGFHERNKAYFSQVIPGANDVTVEPDLKYQIELSGTYYVSSFFVKGYWRYRKFDESETEALVVPGDPPTVVPVVQPEVTENVVGITVGFHW